jgi:hypothetical protein
MLITHRHWAIALGIVACAIVSMSGSVLAGTTGGISGHVVDSATQVGIVGAKIAAASPSQSETVVSDASGSYSFVSLSPDTYTVTATKDGYDATVLHGVNVLADQNQTIRIDLVKTITTLGRVNVTAASALVKPGTTANVYSVNGAAAQAAVALGGTGNLNQAYSAMASVPGVSAVQGQMGWYQPIYIRGGDLDQVGWEFDGIPVNRTYDNAPQTFLSNLGQQELQVYTGGTSANADASGIAGYVNQVIKRGTTPGFATLTGGIGGPAIYQKASIEGGGATPDHGFSYYAGMAAVDQSFRYLDSSNGGSRINSGYFFPINPFLGNASTFAPGNYYGISNTQDRENVANFHLRVGQNDDLQLLYLTSYQWFDIPSSLNDLYGAQTPYSTINKNQGFTVTYADGAVYNGAVFAPPVAPANPCTDPSGNIGNSPFGICYFYPSTPHQYGAFVDRNTRDTNTNSVSIEKVQYQRNFSSNSYLRLFGYGLYSTWYIHGPLAPVLNYDVSIGDYELPSHTYGFVADYSNQLNDKNLLTLSGYYSTTNIERYTTTGGFPGNSAFVAVTSDVGPNGNCFDPITGVQVFCVAPNSPKYNGPYKDLSGNQVQGTLQGPFPGTMTPLVGQWLITETGYRANLNRLRPIFSAVAINDNYKPTDKLTFNIGVRVENYLDKLTDSTTSGFPARAFWFNAYNNEFCFGPGFIQPVQKINGPTDSCAADWGPLASPIQMVNQNPGSFSHTEWEPRLGASFNSNPNDVFRLSAGVYSRPASTREPSWNVTEQNLAAFLGVNFAAYGAFTPNHDVRPDRSTNFDISWEHRFAGSDVSMKLTPFYRSTQDQVQQTIVNALSGLFASFNTGKQTSAGVELGIQKGNFSNDGFAFNLAYTYTHSQIKYNNFSNGRNVIDNMNSYIQLFNSYTASCAGAAPSADPTSLCGPFGGRQAKATEPNGTANPYFTTTGTCPVPGLPCTAQPLFDRNASYEPYDLVPVPFAAANGYEVPSTVSLIINYKKGPFNITPSLAYSSGSKYGSPLSWPGPSPYTPASCQQPDNIVCTPPLSGITSTGWGAPLMIPDPYTGKFDGFGDFKQPSRLTVNVALGYALTKNLKSTVLLSNIVDQCNQRGYAWDYAGICTYSSLPSSFLSPTGGTLAQAAAGPIQLKFPYAMWLNNNNTGFVGVKLPFQATFELSLKI